MKRVSLFGILGLCASLGIACGGRSDSDRANDKTDDINIAETTPIVETGCLTGSGDRFVLTALESGGNAETELYQLIGNNADLSQHVGKKVHVTGDADAPQVADVREQSSAPVATSGKASGAEPQVKTEAQTRLETRRLRVSTVTPTGDDCVEAKKP